MEYMDILFDKHGGVVTITINRPEVLNAFRPRTVNELIHAFEQAGDNPEVGVIILTGAGDRAFCVGGDTKEWKSGVGYTGASWVGIGLPIDRLHRTIRSVPQPVIAAVNGYAIGGGNVLQVVCDLAVASKTAVFGQVGPRVGSFDAGFGTAYLARLVGERKAREVWMLCRRYSAEEALSMGLVNAVVEPEQLMPTVRQWAEEILALSPTALKITKASFNAETEHISGLTQLAFGALGLYYTTLESKEGHQAFMEKRKSDFSLFRNLRQEE
ncbi:1,4-dihydroxy-2-naphthoyl-CoA synthase [Kyrpidia spormannii]|uniref:1,4-dihydroxy-2-naphthoyl-CoA synthase n=1 Tax=Kyrpidia spormannii TaxID=2055160 RepID=A0A2K8N5E0_9BACL|nr:enoyl-CoA hydratase-related protein [Kyrpidia spormannii]ATY84546.1 1,4-dihydroxy-2-naphthoyl-CoA synthase [Kyrpidia spormannii]